MPLENPEIISLGIEPISATAPAGESVRDDPRFEQIAAEIAKLDSLTAGVIDWAAVLQLSTALLKTKSKDYRVASHLVFSLYQLKGLEGLFNGLRMYEGLIRNFWETAFPEKSRIRGRIGALQWLNDRLAAALARSAPKPASENLVLELEKAAQDFVSAVEEKLTGEGAADQIPRFAELSADISGRANDIRARQTEAERAKDEAARKAEALAAGVILETTDADRLVDECREKLLRAAGFYFSTSPADPMSYLIRRNLSWGFLPAAPIHEDGVTHVPTPPASELQRCQALADQGQWLELLGETESNFWDRVFSFSQQRLCIKALENLGTEYQGARDAVVSALASLLRRLPVILTLRFDDGTPFADSMTRSWIESEVLPALPGPGGTRAASAAGSEIMGAIEGAANEAKRLAGSGKLQEAVGLFSQGIDNATRKRQRFLWRLHLARLCVDLGKAQLALPQLISLDEEVTRYGLDEWEPELSLEVVRELFLCRQKLAADLPERPPDLQHHLEELYHRLCRLDVGAASTIEL